MGYYVGPLSDHAANRLREAQHGLGGLVDGENDRRRRIRVRNDRIERSSIPHFRAVAFLPSPPLWMLATTYPRRSTKNVPSLYYVPTVVVSMVIVSAIIATNNIMFRIIGSVCY